MLDTERYAKYRYTQQQSEKQMGGAQFNSADKYPYDVAYRAHYAETARRNIPPERPEYKSRDFKALHAERY